MKRLLGVAALLSAGAASADPCAAPEQPWVDVETPPPAIGAAAARSLIEQLRAGLAGRGIAVCDAKNRPAHPAIALVVFGTSEGERIRIDVAVSDAITDKRVSRTVDLSPLPRDAWPLMLALATEEVLRASWAELALAQAPPPKRPVPAAVREAVHASLRPTTMVNRRAHRAWFGAAAAFDAYAVGQLQLGMDARGTVWLSRVLFASAAAGFRSGSVVTSEHGDIHARAACFSLGPGVSLTDRDALVGVEAVQRTELSFVGFEGEPDARASGRTASATAAYARAWIVGWLAPDPALRVALEVGGGAPLRAARASDSGAVVTGFDGVSVSLALAFGGVF